jgi:hypothetical protein
LAANATDTDDEDFRIFTTELIRLAKFFKHELFFVSFDIYVFGIEIGIDVTLV